MTELTKLIAERGDIGHLALFLWASCASGLLAMAFRELVAANRRFEFFMRELARFNRRFGREA